MLSKYIIIHDFFKTKNFAVMIQFTLQKLARVFNKSAFGINLVNRETFQSISF